MTIIKSKQAGVEEKDAVIDVINQNAIRLSTHGKKFYGGPKVKEFEVAKENSMSSMQ